VRLIVDDFPTALQPRSLGPRRGDHRAALQLLGLRRQPARLVEGLPHLRIAAPRPDEAEHFQRDHSAIGAEDGETKEPARSFGRLGPAPAIQGEVGTNPEEPVPGVVELSVAGVRERLVEVALGEIESP
jgi:hypothetical protein